jgi:hypothetical protein
MHICQNKRTLVVVCLMLRFLVLFVMSRTSFGTITGLRDAHRPCDEQ